MICDWLLVAENCRTQVDNSIRCNVRFVFESGR
jgi:hypothetical protein